MNQNAASRSAGQSEMIKQKEAPEGAPRGFRLLVLQLLPQLDVHRGGQERSQ
jgi:hypothetical protein